MFILTSGNNLIQAVYTETGNYCKDHLTELREFNSLHFSNSIRVMLTHEQCNNVVSWQSNT